MSSAIMPCERASDLCACEDRNAGGAIPAKLSLSARATVIAGYPGEAEKRALPISGVAGYPHLISGNEQRTLAPGFRSCDVSENDPVFEG